MWPSVRITKWDMAPLSPQVSSWEKFKITAYILKSSNYIFMSIHAHSHLETLLVLHILKKDLTTTYSFYFSLFVSLIFSFL